MARLTIILIILITLFTGCRTVDEEPQEELIEPPIVETEIKASLSKAHPLTESEMFAVRSEEDNIFIASLDRDNKIHLLNLAAIENRLEITGNNTVYSYEKYDKVVHLDLFSTSNAIIISHLERYYNQLLISYQLATTGFKTEPLIHTDSSPRIYRKDNTLKLFYHNIETNSISLYELNTLDFKGRDISNESKLNGSIFSTDYDEKSGRILFLWTKGEPIEELYLSIMDENLRGYKPVVKLEFDQNIELPKLLLDKESLSLFFNLDYKNKYLSYPIEELNRELNELNTTSFDFGESLNINEYLIDEVFKTDEYKVVLFKRENKELKHDETYIAIYSYRYKYYNLLYLKDIKGLTSNYRLLSHKGSLYLFWLENRDRKSRLYYSRIELMKNNSSEPVEKPEQEGE